MTKPAATYYLTTPIYYVNDRPHIGHAYTTIAADVMARHRRAAGDQVFFLTGVDEHGQKVEKAAAAAGIAPQEHCDRMAPRFRELWRRLAIEPSAFLRTTDAGHRRVVEEALRLLDARGLIERRDFEGWYCVPCERYWTEKDLAAEHCPDCRRPVERLCEANYFFLMSRFAGRLKEAIVSGAMEILPVARRNEVLGFLDKGLGDLCISRPKRRLAWGIPLPFDPDYVTYVWFDALMNYVSGPRYLAADGADVWPADAHLIGKDILTTHAVYWPAMLMALDLPLPRRIVAHGWWNFSGEKMSKTLGNVVDPLALIEDYAAADDDREAVDAFRHFVMSEVTFGLDGAFSLEAFERRWTADLSNDLGNLLSRVVALIARNHGGRVAAAIAPLEGEVALAAYRSAMDSYQFSRAIEETMALLRSANQRLQERAPWKQGPDAVATLGEAAGGLRLAMVMLAPFMPRSAARIAAALGLDAVPSLGEALTPFETRCAAAPPLFRRPERRAPAAAPGEAPAQKNEPPVPATIEDVKRLGLKVGVIKAAAAVPKTAKLLKLRVDLGSEERTLVAGIALRHKPEELVGRRVVVVANLAPATIRGIESRGMILAAADGERIELISPEGEPPAGAEVR